MSSVSDIEVIKDLLERGNSVIYVVPSHYWARQELRKIKFVKIKNNEYIADNGTRVITMLTTSLIPHGSRFQVVLGPIENYNHLVRWNDFQNHVRRHIK